MIRLTFAMGRNRSCTLSEEGLPMGLFRFFFPAMKRRNERKRNWKRKRENGKFGESSESGVGAFKVKEEGGKQSNRKEWKGGLMWTQRARKYH